MRRGAALGVALAIVAVALALAHGQVFRAGAAQFVPIALEASRVPVHPLRSADVAFEAWLVARHARTLLRAPHELFDTPHCAPAEHTLTLGVGAIALGLLATPAAMASHEPLLVYNVARVLSSAVAALALYALVSGWTGRRAAGLVAGLLYAFDPLRPDLASHPPEWDLAFAAAGLLFAERWFAEGRWRDAVSLAACCALQIAASFYALLAAALLALPLGLWLLLRRSPRRASLAQLAFVAAAIALAALLLLGPYASARNTGEIGGRATFFYASWRDYLPGGIPGVAVALLAAVGLAAPRRLTWRIAGDPRPALVAAAALVALVAAGSTTVPGFDPYALLARVIPGLDAVRDVSLLATAVHLVLCVLAGAGVTAAIVAAGRAGFAVSFGAVALALWLCFGLGERRWLLEDARPSHASIDFFAELARESDAGALLELPLDSVHGAATGVDARRVLLSSWHGRRTSACFASFPPPGRAQLEALVSALPQREAVDALRELGFTTLIFHRPPQLGAWLDDRFERASEGPDATLRRLASDGSTTAFALVPR